MPLLAAPGAVVRHAGERGDSEKRYVEVAEKRRGRIGIRFTTELHEVTRSIENPLPIALPGKQDRRLAPAARWGRAIAHYPVPGAWCPKARGRE